MKIILLIISELRETLKINTTIVVINQNKLSIFVVYQLRYEGCSPVRANLFRLCYILFFSMVLPLLLARVMTRQATRR